MLSRRAGFLALLIPLLYCRPGEATTVPNSCKPSAYGHRLDARYHMRDGSGNYLCLVDSVEGERVLALRRAFFQANSTATKSTTPAQNASSLLSTWALEASSQLTDIRDQSIGALKADSSAEFDPFARQFLDALNTLIKESGQLATVGDWQAKEAANDPLYLPDSWVISTSGGQSLGSLPAKFLSERGCLNAAESAACDLVYKQAVDLSDALFLVGEVVTIMASSGRADLVSQAALREKEWHAYLYDAQFQYWWELALNRYIEVRCPALLAWECQRPKVDNYGNQLGFRAAPSEKLMFLHPDVGLEYLHDQPAGSRLKPAIVFQWIGYQRWSWNDGQIANLKGLALVTTVADTAKGKPFGFGLQLQWRKYSVAVTSHGGDIGLTISLGVIDWLGTVNQSWAESLEKPLPK